MARDFATINTGIWGNPDVRALPPLQQWLFLQAWTHPDLSYAGVLDWRPGRNIAPLSAGSTAGSIESIVPILEQHLFFVVDHETEELLVRSYLRHDGLLKSPNMAVAMTKAYAAVGSNRIRGVIVHELLKLQSEFPEWGAWRIAQVQTILKHPAIDPRDNPTAKAVENPTPTPSENPLPNPSVRGLATTTATTTTTEKSSAASRGTRLPDGWRPSDEMAEWTRTHAPSQDFESELEKFNDYWHARAGAAARKVSWDLTWKGWVGRNHAEAVARGWQPMTSQQDLAGMEYLAR